VERFEIDRLFEHGSEDGWSRFRAAYSDSGVLVAFSAPVCSRDGSSALVLVSVANGPVSSALVAVFAERVDGRWRESGRRIVLES
jgi:hypothetical protein